MYTRLYALSEQMWRVGEPVGFEEFRQRVYHRRSHQEKLGIGGDWDERY